MFACAGHLASSHVLVGLISDNPGLVYLDPRAWTIGGFLVEEQPIRVHSGCVADQRQIIRILFLPGPSSLVLDILLAA